jgi:predicted metal-dependent hydrolase
MQNVRIIRSRRKTLSIEIHPDGEIWVRSPQLLPKHEIDRVLVEKQDWIQRKSAEMEKLKADPQTRNFTAGEQFPYLGKGYPLTLGDRARPPLVLKQGRFLLYRGAHERAEAVFEAWYRKEALRIFAERVSFYVTLTGLQPKRLRLSSARTRWGSCSTSGTISLNWRLILAPQEALDYVILHELAHLKIKNHQRDFWDLVKKMQPDYTVRRKWLKDHGHQLSIR